MQYSNKYHMNKPERADQYNLDHWNENTSILDTVIDNVANCIISSDTTISGNNLNAGNIIRIMFTSDINGSNDTTGLTITYNENPYPVKVYKNGVLVNFTAKEVTSGSYKYLQAYKKFEFVYDGENFVLVSNPIILEGLNYKIRADGTTDDGFVGDIKSRAIRNIPYGWLECNGQSVLRSDYPDLFNYFNTQYNTDDVSDPNRKTLLEVYGYADSTHFNIPDYRETVLVGDGRNATDTIATHDIYTVGQFKDDCLQKITGSLATNSRLTNNSVTMPSGAFGGVYTNDAPAPQTGYAGIGTFNFDSSRVTRSGTTTHGKQKGVVYTIKAF